MFAAVRVPLLERTNAPTPGIARGAHLLKQDACCVDGFHRRLDMKIILLMGDSVLAGRYYLAVYTAADDHRVVLCSSQGLACVSGKHEYSKN
jgi:hypothetical protein